MPSNKEQVYLLKGPHSLLQAAYQELKALFHQKSDLVLIPHMVGVCFTRGLQPWGTYEEDRGDIVLTLPQDWNTLMDILEGLKKPQVPEYVEHKLTGKVGKVYDSRPANFETQYRYYDVYGNSSASLSTYFEPITEAEFIESGLKELEEAGFVKGAKVEHRPLTRPKGSTYEIHLVDYQNTTKEDDHNSCSTDDEVRAKGFSFRVRGSGHSAPPQQLTILPSLPTTSQGIPYLVKDSNVYLGLNDGESKTHIGTLKHWLKLGVSSITLPCGTLTSQDLKTIVGL